MKNQKKSHVIRKIILFATIIFPLIALIVRSCYRKKYHLPIFKKKPEIESTIGQRLYHAPHTLQKKIDHFLSHYLSWLKRISDKNTLSELVKTGPTHYEISISSLNDYLENIQTYEKHGSSIVEICYHALNGLMKDKNNLQAAKQVFCTIAAFFRKQYSEQEIDFYKKKAVSYSLSELGSTREEVGFSILAEKMSQQMSVKSNHRHIWYLMKLLRRQIMLTNSETVKEIANKISKIENSSKILNCLRLTFLHGTKTNVIFDAFANTDGCLLPLGELQKRNIVVLNGETEEGSIGVNANNLSGAPLAYANRCLSYATAATKDFDLCRELNEYSEFINSNYSIKDGSSGYEARNIQGVLRLLRTDPEKVDRNKVIEKLKNIYSRMENSVFKAKPREIFKYGIDKDGNPHGFHCTIKFLDALESALKFAQPLTEREKQLFQSRKPLVIGTTKVIPNHTTWPYRTEECDELCYPHELKFNREIDIIFTEDGRLPEGSENIYKGEVYSFDILNQAQKVEQSLFSTFYDVLNVIEPLSV